MGNFSDILAEKGSLSKFVVAAVWLGHPRAASPRFARELTWSVLKLWGGHPSCIHICLVPSKYLMLGERSQPVFG